MTMRGISRTNGFLTCASPSNPSTIGFRGRSDTSSRVDVSLAKSSLPLHKGKSTEGALRYSFEAAPAREPLWQSSFHEASNRKSLPQSKSKRVSPITCCPSPCARPPVAAPPRGSIPTARAICVLEPGPHLPRPFHLGLLPICGEFVWGFRRRERREWWQPGVSTGVFHRPLWSKFKASKV